MPSLLRQLQDGSSSEKAGSMSKRMDPAVPPPRAKASTTSKAREVAHREFLEATMTWQRVFADCKSLPDLETAFSSFKQTYSRYSETLAMESLRVQEYAHLEESGRVCMDYCGFGLFSYLQQYEDWESASFGLSSLSVNLCSHALFGAAQEGTVECDIRKRIMEYLNVQDSEYSMVFTASRGASFKLLADAYPFATCRKLLTMYDYESESVGWLMQGAKEKGAKIFNVSFRWPSLRIVSTQLRKLLVSKGNRRRTGSATGLFVFPVQSRVSGAKYSYQWMSLAQQNKWHVLLDASAMGPKDMDSLGLSMFKPDFIVASFYKVFGADPSGFGCLFIKNSAMQSIQTQSGAAAPGIVRIIPCPLEWASSGSSDENPQETEVLVDEESGEEATTEFEFPRSTELIQGVASFSGPMLGFEKFSSPEERTAGTNCGREEDDYDNDQSSICESTGEMSRSPVFSEEGTENLFCLDVGASPADSGGRPSLSEDQFSGPFSGPLSGPIHNPVCNGHLNSYGSGGLRNPLFEEDMRPGNGTKDKTCAILINGKHQNAMDSASSSMECKRADGSAKTQAEESQNLFDKKGASSSLASTDFRGMNGPQVTKNPMDVAGSVEHREVSEIEIVEDPCGALIPQGGPQQNLAWNQSESAIRRETEGDFRLLDRRDGGRLLIGENFSPLARNLDELGSFNGRRSFVSTEHALDSYLGQEGQSLDHEDADYVRSDEDADELEQFDDREPEVVCRSLDHVDMLGLNKTTLRLRYLVNWVVSSMLQLQHPGTENVMLVVHVYGPQIKYDRGASIAFNVFDCHGKVIHPEVVQMLADKHNISLSIGFLQNLQVPDGDPELLALEDCKRVSKPKTVGRGKMLVRMEVVTVALSVLSTFEDVYKLWIFLARFLDADFVCKELTGHPEL